MACTIGVTVVPVGSGLAGDAKYVHAFEIVSGLLVEVPAFMYGNSACPDDVSSDGSGVAVVSW